MTKLFADRRARDAFAIAAGGAAIAVAPGAWARLVWPASAVIDVGGWFLVFTFSVGPFLLLALLRFAHMTRVATSLAMLAVAPLVVAGQVAGLDPHDPSSTSAIAIVTTPVLAAVVVLVVWAIDRGLAALVARRG